MCLILSITPHYIIYYHHPHCVRGPPLRGDSVIGSPEGDYYETLHINLNKKTELRYSLNTLETMWIIVEAAIL